MVIKLWKIKKNILPQIKMHLSRRNYKNIDEMFSEIYLYNDGKYDYICFQTNGGDGTGDISMMFYAINGAYYDIGQWSYIKKNGVKIT